MRCAKCNIEMPFDWYVYQVSAAAVNPIELLGKDICGICARKGLVTKQVGQVSEREHFKVICPRCNGKGYL